MSDQRLRDLERAYQADGGPEELAAYLAERLRTDGNLVLRLIKRVIALERNVPNTMNLPVEDTEILDFLDNDRELPTVSVPSVFSLDGPTPNAADFQMVTSQSGFENLPSETIATPALDEYRVREILTEEPVRLHAHYHCVKPDCLEQQTYEFDHASSIMYHTPSGWQRHSQMLLCSMHSYMAHQICDQEMGGHVHPDYPPTNSTFSCVRCGYGPIYPN